MKTITKIIPHACIILSTMLIVFYVVDRFNTAMAFIDNKITKTLILVLGILSVLTSVMLIAFQRRASWQQVKKQSECNASKHQEESPFYKELDDEDS